VCFVVLLVFFFLFCSRTPKLSLLSNESEKKERKKKEQKKTGKNSCWRTLFFLLINDTVVSLLRFLELFRYLLSLPFFIISNTTQKTRVSKHTVKLSVWPTLFFTTTQGLFFLSCCLEVALSMSKLHRQLLSAVVVVFLLLLSFPSSSGTLWNQSSQVLFTLYCISLSLPKRVYKKNYIEFSKANDNDCFVLLLLSLLKPKPNKKGISISVDQSTGDYQVSLDGEVWLKNAPTSIHLNETWSVQSIK